MSSENSSEGRTQDKTRLCPTCRMEISVLATKCRFCGEEVGRPKDASRKLTIDDLGGETIEHYAPSSSVMEALEAFRSEESLRKGRQTKPVKKGSKLFGGKNETSDTEESQQIPETQLPPLSSESRILASAADSAPFKSKPFPDESKRLRLQSKSIIVGSIVSVVILGILFTGYIFAPKIHELVSARGSNTFIFPENPALKLIESDTDPLEILDVAIKHQRKYDNPENRAVVEDAAKKVIEKIEILLSKNPYDRSNLTEAWDIISRAYIIYPTETLLEIKNMVSQEIRLYGLILSNTNLDKVPPTAEFLIVDAHAQQVPIVVKEGEQFCDGRFQLLMVKREEAIILDTKYDNRKLRCNKIIGITKF